MVEKSGETNKGACEITEIEHKGEDWLGIVILQELEYGNGTLVEDVRNPSHA